MQALQIFAGPRARQHIERHGLMPGHIATIPGAAGGPKGLTLGPLDRFIFGQWLPQSQQAVNLVGASIGAWRMATACLQDTGSDPLASFKRLEHDYIHQHYELAPGQKRPAARVVSERFGQSLSSFYNGRLGEVLANPRYALHIITSRGRHVLGREQAWRTPLGYLGAFVTNSVRRKAMGAWLERVVFSSGLSKLPFAVGDYRTRQVDLTAHNFMDALQASCSIPFVLNAVHDIAGAPKGAYWDGGITDYHLHLNYNAAAQTIANYQANTGANAPFDTQNDNVSNPVGLVLYPHFQKSVVPGWLDKSLKWRHKATHFLDTTVLLAPNPNWVKTLPNGKLPDRNDFTHYGNDLAGRVKAWTTAVKAGEQLADEFAAWLHKPDARQVMPL
jgi:hypothetical protein